MKSQWSWWVKKIGMMIEWLKERTEDIMGHLSGLKTMGRVMDILIRMNPLVN